MLQIPKQSTLITVIMCAILVYDFSDCYWNFNPNIAKLGCIDNQPKQRRYFLHYKYLNILTHGAIDQAPIYVPLEQKTHISRCLITLHNPNGSAAITE